MCDSSNTNGLIILSSGITVFVNTLVDTDPVCIRCGTFGQLYTDPTEVMYIIDGNTITASTPGFNLTQFGLIVDDPANTFTDGEQASCIVASQSISNVFTIEFLGKGSTVHYFV